MNEFTSKIKGKKGLRKKQEKGLRLKGNKKRKDKYKKGGEREMAEFRE